MILKPADLKKMVTDLLAAGHTVELDLNSGKLRVAPSQAVTTDADFITWGKK